MSESIYMVKIQTSNDEEVIIDVYMVTTIIKPSQPLLYNKLPQSLICTLYYNEIIKFSL